MKYIKDFFYNLSDLFIILLILGIAGGLIYWRFNIIMDYPEALAAEIRETATQNLVPSGDSEGENAEGENAEGENAEGENAEGENAEGGDAQGENAEGGDAQGGDAQGENAQGENAQGENSQGENAGAESGETPAPIDTSSGQEPGSGPRDNTIWKDGKLRVDMNVELASGSSEIAVESLVQAGLFTSYEDFVAVCEKIEADPGMVAAGAYSFPAGSSQEDIADIVTM